MPLTPRARLTLALLLAIGLAPVFAHEVPVEHVVEMVVEPRAGDLLVRVHLPAAVVADPNAPGVTSTSFGASFSDQRQRIVAADLAHNLELQQGEAVLAATVEAARVSADRAALDVELRYPGADPSAPVSVRLNAFRTSGASVRTNVRFRWPSGRDHIVGVTGPPERITLNPGFGEVLRQFIGRGVRVLLGGGDHLLFLLCALLPIRRVRAVLTLFAAAGAGQATAIVCAVLWPAAAEPLVAIFATVAASTLVVAALQNIVRARERLVVALATVFGLLNGFSIGHEFVVVAPLAWSHAFAAAAIFAATILVGELWLGALAWATRIWLDERGIAERIVTVVASALVVHSAAHRLVERGQFVGAAGTFGTERALVWIALGWISVMLIVAAANALSARSRDGGDVIAAPTGAQPS